jgi:transcriptional regulator with XRE-family HTH domain
MPAKKPTIKDIDRGKRIKKLREAAGFTSQEALAKKVGVSRPAITQAENGDAFKIDTAIKLAKALNVDLDSLLLGSVRNTNEPVESETKGIPLYDIYAAAGPIEMYSDLQEYIVDYLSFPGIDPKEYDFAVKVWGPSMQGVFDDGDIALCKEVQDRTLINYGAPYFIITSEFKTIKYVHTSDREGYVKLRSENEQFDTFEIPMNSIYKIYHAKAGVAIKINRISS